MFFSSSAADPVSGPRLPAASTAAAAAAAAATTPSPTAAVQSGVEPIAATVDALQCPFAQHLSAGGRATVDPAAAAHLQQRLPAVAAPPAATATAAANLLQPVPQSLSQSAVYRAATAGAALHTLYLLA